MGVESVPDGRDKDRRKSPRRRLVRGRASRLFGSAVLTRRVKGLHAVVVHLQRRVRPRPHEPHQMIGIVVDVHVGLADRMVVGPHVVNDHDVPVYLSPANKYK